MSKRESAQSLSALLEEKRVLVDLAEDKGFLFLSSLVQEQADHLQQSILFTPCTGIDSAISQEYNKGMLEGRLSWETVRKAYIDSLDVTINHLRSKEDDTELDDGSTNAP